MIKPFSCNSCDEPFYLGEQAYQNTGDIEDTLCDTCYMDLYRRITITEQTIQEYLTLTGPPIVILEGK